MLLGNLEDAIPADAKVAARARLHRARQGERFGGTGLWTRVNALNSPWALDDLLEIVGEVGDKLDVMMLPKVEGPWDIHYVDQLLAQLEARYGVEEADPHARHPRDRRGGEERRGHRRRLAAHARHEPRARGPCRLARHEDDARRRRPSRVQGRRRSGTGRGRAGVRPAGPLALHHRPHGRRLSRERHQGLLRPVRRLLRRRSPARSSSATPSSWAAPAPGRCTPRRSPSPRRSSLRTRPRSRSRRRSSKPCRTALALS